MFTKVLVANRGEIAVRIMRTLRDLGIASVAVYSDADRDALHVEMADEAVRIGPTPALQSYLDVAAVVDAAVRTGAEAIHPGYGFLSENPALAEACVRVGVVFIGPDQRSLVLMGDKRAAKETVAALGVPVVPGVVAAGMNDAALETACASVGFPVIVKPSAGGGGKGMRVVREAVDLAPALASARREASAAFGDDALILERYIGRARHVEVQVVGDGHGEAIHLGDRDCSLQRRHQKVIEEAPAPGLTHDVRARMHEDAVTIARSVGYRGVGTVEFVVDVDAPSTYYFLEMNTRLQVEHPVTEAVTGLDLVALQLVVAAGEPLPLTQDDVTITGHAVEARVYAEDGHHGFLPSSGSLLVCRLPEGVRVDSGVREGDVVGTAYDPLMLKVIASGRDRDAAFDALDRALTETEILGVAHNLGVVRALVSEPRVREGVMTTSLIDELACGEGPAPVDVDRICAAALVVAESRDRDAASLWRLKSGWRIGDHAPVVTTLVDDGGVEHVVSVLGPTSACTLSLDDGVAVSASLGALADGVHVTVSIDGHARTYATAVDASASELVAWVGSGGDAWSFRVPVRHRLRRPEDEDDTDGELRSPMPGSIVVVNKSSGDDVAEGEVIAVVEAMKMEYPLVSPFQGTLVSVDVVLGSQVARDQVVAVVRADIGDAGAAG